MIIGDDARTTKYEHNPALGADIPEGIAVPSPWLLITWIPLLAGIIALLALIPLWGWVFIIIPIIGLLYLPYYYVRCLKTYLARRRREEAIQRAITRMPPDERNLWFNREGPYQDPRCIPRETPVSVVTEKKRYRYGNAIGEFSEGEYEPASNFFYD
ncbi:MAG: hypothetical protein ACREJ0_12800 [Geminicoccaceae bacterium]